MDTKGKVIDVLKKLGLVPFEDDDRVCFFLSDDLVSLCTGFKRP